jgi:two-component system cell cycle sensor histidine kinase/response regulator CckA
MPPVVPLAPIDRKPLRALILEDCPADAELLLHELAIGYDVHSSCIETAEAMREALRDPKWQLVLSDYSMPTFSAPAALAILHELHLDLPFIIVSGTIGEETAVAALKAGACDFLVKGRLARLIPAIERALREVEIKRERAATHAALEEQLRQSQKMEGIGRLAGGIAHDFNNMLTAIIGYSDMVLDQIGPDKPISQDLEEIRKAGNRAVALTGQLLAFSRKQTLNITAVDVNDVIVHTRSMLQRLIGEDIQVEVALAPELGPILADRIQLEQVLMNLATNARDAMPRGGTLTIETIAVEAAEVALTVLEPVTRGSYVRLRITDTGFGMDEPTRTRVFEPFFSTKALGQGTGLGLATVYGVVQQLGGYITVNSEPGRGTTFTLHFAVSTLDVSTAASSRPRGASAVAESGQVVLLVEDDGGVRQLVSRVLRRHGYTVIESEGPEQTVALLADYTGRLDLILSDIVMPAMDGPQMISRLRETRPRVKVLYMSGYSGETIARRAGVETMTVLQKPFTAAGLLGSVRDAMAVEPEGSPFTAARTSGS